MSIHLHIKAYSASGPAIPRRDLDLNQRRPVCARVCGSHLQLQTGGGVTLRVSERHILPAIKVESERDLRCLDNEPHLNY